MLHRSVQALYRVFLSILRLQMTSPGEIGCSAAGWAPMGPLATTAIRGDLNLTASGHPENILFGCK
jgi:hypothetical protein